MSSANLNPSDEVRLADHIVEQVTGRASGRLEDECLVNQPRDRYFVGSLRPREDSEDHLSRGLSSELLSKLAPSAFGLELRLAPHDLEAALTVEVAWSCYYLVFPMFAQQVAHQRQPAPLNEDASDSAPEIGDVEPTVEVEAVPDSAQDLDDPDALSVEALGIIGTGSRRRRPSDSLFVRFRKVPCRVDGRVSVAVGQDGSVNIDPSPLQTAIDAEIARAMAIASGDPDRLRASGPAAEPIRVPDSALIDEPAFTNFLHTLATEVPPYWRLETTAEARVPPTEGSEIDVRLEWENTSPRFLNARGRDSLNTETYIFDARAQVSVDGAEIRPYELQLAPRGFRYDRELWGRGFNVEVVRASEASLRTEATPVYRQARNVTQTEPEAKFGDLAADPAPILNRVREAMSSYVAVWDRGEADYRSSAGWNAAFESEFQRDKAQYVEEIRRYQRGVELVERNADVNLAFRLMNETFRRGRNHAWRLFQLIFVVGQIPGTAALVDSDDVAEREYVDIVFFPTGGGKTEAYLATVVFHLFLDRLRGKTAGVTAWIRFPLRLLTLQQTQRVSDVVGIAELVRRESDDPRLVSADPFAVGYFVGQDGSPNEIADPAAVGRGGTRFAPGWSQARDPDARQGWKRIARCPSCGTRSVQVEFDEANVRLTHRCTTIDCAFPGGVLPVYVVDNEIYRYLPSVLVGTIDKLAGIGNQRKVSMMFGKVEGRCNLHGYYFRRCTQSGCRDRNLLVIGAPGGLTGPTLFVQDELHLLREGLGTFDGHYETFVHEMARRFGSPRIKIIASSATIEAFARQVEHLFGRPAESARVFPGPGPRLAESFYASTLEYPQRLFIGILPHNKTIFNAILEILELYHRIIAELVALPSGSSNPFGGETPPGTAEWDLLLDRYRTSLTYFLNKRELDSTRTDFEGDLNPNLRAAGMASVEVLELTSGVGTDEVERTLAHLEQTGSADGRHPDAVLATSMVSHGVDLDRLNMMLFYGMPRQTSEYIQASSRVGRSSCGVVFVALHPARERDQSHYQYFTKYHEFLGQLVEPVAINRWAKFAMNRTMPGLFMAVLLQVVATESTGDPNQYYMVDALKRKIASGEIGVRDFVPMLEQAYYGASTPDTDALIEDQVRRYLDQLLSAPGSVVFASDALIPKPMSSLREVDEQIEIELDASGTIWAGRA